MFSTCWWIEITVEVQVNNRLNAGLLSCVMWVFVNVELCLEPQSCLTTDQHSISDHSSYSFSFLSARHGRPLPANPASWVCVSKCLTTKHPGWMQLTEKHLNLWLLPLSWKAVITEPHTHKKKNTNEQHLTIITWHNTKINKIILIIKKKKNQSSRYRKWQPGWAKEHRNLPERKYESAFSLLHIRWCGPQHWGVKTCCWQPKCVAQRDGDRCKHEVDSIKWASQRATERWWREGRRIGLLSLSVLDASERAKIPRSQKSAHFSNILLCLSWASSTSSTYQLELTAAIIGVLDAHVGPQRLDGGQVVQEDWGLQLPTGHLGRAGVEGHQAVAVLLVGRVAPRDVQLFAGVNQHAGAWREEVRR